MGLIRRSVTFACLVTLIVLGPPARADGRLSPQGGTITSVGATAGGGLTGGGTGGPVYLGLQPCSSGQVLAWNGTAYACADGSALTVLGTVTHLPFFTPDGHHLGDSPVTYSSGAGELDAPLTRLQLGQGVQAGAPTHSTVATVSGSGSLTGVYMWRYYEEGQNGNTSLSPASSPLTLASQNALVVIGLARAGMSARDVCRTKAGGSTYYLVHTFGGGAQFHSTSWVDTVADTSLVTLCPTVDTTLGYSLDLAQDVKFLRTMPNYVAQQHDLTLLTADPSVAGSFALDSYGAIVARVANGDAFEAMTTGLNPEAFGVYYTPDLDAGTGMNPSGVQTKVWSIGAQGSQQIAPFSINDSGTTRDTHSLIVLGTLPAVATIGHSGFAVDITSAGSSSQTQAAASIILEAGYSGSSSIFGIDTANGAVTTGTGYGLRASASGASTNGVGVEGKSFNCTNCVGVFGGLATDMPTGHTAAIYADNGAGSGDLFLATHSSTVEFEVTSAGALSATTIATGGVGGAKWSKGTGVPVISCAQGDLFSRTDGGVGTTLYDCTATNTWTASTSASGTVTSVATGSGLTGGTITTTGTVSLNINAGSTQTCGAGTAVTALTALGITSCSAFGSSSFTNGAGNNVLIKSNGTNGVASTISDTGTAITATSPITVSMGAGVTTGVYLAQSGQVTWNIEEVNSSNLLRIYNSSTGLAATFTSNTSVAFTGAGSFGGAVDLGTHKLTSVSNGTASNDGAAFGQIATAVNAAVSGTSGQVPVFTGTNAIGNSIIAASSSAVTIAGTTQNALVVQNTTAASTVEIEESAANGGKLAHIILDNNGEWFFRNPNNAGTFIDYGAGGFFARNSSNANKFTISDAGAVVVGSANTDTLTVTAKVASHIYYNGTAPTYSCVGSTVDTASTDERGRIVTPDTSCVLTFAVAYTTNAPFCTANASTNIPVGVTTTTTAATFTMGSKPASMTWHCDGGL